MIGEPFHCHENAVFVTPSGKQISLQDRNRIDVTVRVPVGEYRPRDGEEWMLCKGYAELEERLKAEHRDFEKDWQVKLTAKLLEVIEKAELEGEEWDDARCAQEVRAVMDSMNREHISK